MSRTFIVAELGGIAEGSLPVMLRQIDAAAEAGVDCVKPQWVSDASRIVTQRRSKRYGGSYEHIRYPKAWLGTMRKLAHTLGLGFYVSCYIPEDVPIVAKHADVIKLASFENCESDEMLRAVSQHHVIVSLGMTSDERTREVVARRDAMPWVFKAGVFCPPSLLVLHCVSKYDGPIPPSQWNLGAIRHYNLDGFSDHTRHIEAGHDAVMAGARVVEVHMRLDDSSPHNPDFGVAWPPARLREYVQGIRLAERTLGTGIKRVMPCERDMARFRVRQG